MTAPDFRARAAEWLFQQGTSTVLLVAILAWLAYAFKYEVPAHIEQINAQHERTQRETRRAYESDQARDETRYNALFKVHFESSK